MAAPLIGTASGTGSSSVANYTAVANGVNSFVNWQTSLSFQPVTIPTATTLSNLYFKVTTAPGGSASWTITVMKNGVATSLSVVVAGSATSNTDTVNTATFAAGDTMTIRSSPSGTPAAGGANYWNMSSSAAGQILSVVSPAGTASAEFLSLMGYSSTLSETRAGMIMPCAGTFSDLYVNIGTAPGGAASKTTTLRVNGVSSALTTTVTGAATSNSDTSNSVAVVAGDRINYSNTVASAPASGVTRVSAIFTPTNTGDIVFGGGTDDDASTTATEYQTPSTGNGTWSTEASRQVVLGDYTLKSFYGRVNVASGAARSWAFTVRKNTADTSLAVTLANIITVVSSTVDVPILQGDLISIKSVPSGTPTGAGRANFGLLMWAPGPKAETLTDNFNTGSSPDVAKWTNWGGANVTLSSGQLNILGGTASGQYFGMDSLIKYDLTASYAFSRLVAEGTPSTNWTINPVNLTLDSNNILYWDVNNGVASPYMAVAGSYTNVGATSHTHTNGDWYRIREASGTIYWDYSTDGISWTNLTSTTTPFAITNLTSTIITGALGTIAARTAILDNYNVPGSSASTQGMLLMF